MKVACVAPLVAGALLLTACNSMSDGARIAAVAKAAPIVSKDVHAANGKLSELSDLLQEANEKMARKEYPSALAGQLDALSVPFDAGNLDQRAITDFPREVVRALLDYAAQAQALNRSTGQLKNVLSMLEPQVKKAWQEEKEPVVSYSVVFESGAGGATIAQLVPVKSPFKLDGPLPNDFVVVVPDYTEGKTRAREKQAKRWQSGALVGADPIAIPVSPQTTAFLIDKALPQLRLRIIEAMEVIRGSNLGTPSETPGLLKTGEKIEQELAKLAAAK
ncbi:MAG: hypothetical protein R3B70_13880 [Polyangiaceae bacterium]